MARGGLIVGSRRLRPKAHRGLAAGSNSEKPRTPKVQQVDGLVDFGENLFYNFFLTVRRKKYKNFWQK